MTEIAFHFNVLDRLSYVCRLLRKAVGSGAKVVVTGPTDALDAIDAALWTLSPTDFIPHCGLDVGAAVLHRSPVVLAPSIQSAPFRGSLVNLGEWVPAGFDQFERIIEVVTLDELARKQARARWKHYADVGLRLTRHDLQQVSS